MMIRKWDSGPEVRKVQELLNSHGWQLRVDGQFGNATELAVRDFQRRVGLLADGIVGRRTRQRLEEKSVARAETAQEVVKRVGPASAALFTVQTQPGRSASKSAKLIQCSDAGLGFIYKHEAWPGVSNRLHWPQGASGVTLGAGYDSNTR